MGEAVKLDAETIFQARVAAYAAGTGTHLPLLASVIAIARPGPVIEIGTGHCSAPMIAEMCAAMGREWFVVDHVRDWLDNINDLSPLGRLCTADAAKLDTFSGLDAGVAFVDSSPPLDRLEIVKRIRPHAEFIVIHDADNQGGDLAELLEYLKTFPHQFMYTRMRPWTTVVSDVRAYPGGGL